MKKYKKFVLCMVAICLILTGCTSRLDRLSAQKENNNAVAAADNIPSAGNGGCVAQKYKMTLTLDTDNNKIFGYEDINILNTSETALDKIGIRYFTRAVTSDSEIASIYYADTGETLEVSTGPDDTVIYASLGGKELAPEQAMTLRIEFSTSIPENDDRFGYHQEDFGKMYLLTFWAPQLAMYENGEWNESPYFAIGESTYNAMSDYTVQLTAPSDYIIAASGTQITHGNTTIITAPNVREMAIIACNYMSVESETVNGVTFNMYRPSYEKYDTLYDVMFANAKEAVVRFDDQLGSYIYDELDIVPAYITAGGMEMPGLIIEALPDGGRDVESGDYYSAAITVTHEVAHQWFYCAVGNDQYNEPWLDEAFATYYSEYFYQKTENDALTITESAEKTLDSEADYSSSYSTGDFFDEDDIKHYVNLPCNYYDAAVGYGQYVYELGAYFLDCLHTRMGDSFDMMMSDWYQEHSLGIVHSSDFIRTVLQYDSSDEVVEILNQYLSEKNIR